MRPAPRRGAVVIPVPEMWFLLLALVLAFPASAGGPARPTAPVAPRATVVPNDNRVPAGVRRAGVLELSLVARTATWHPTPRVDSVVTVQVFAEEILRFEADQRPDLCA